MDKTPAHIDVFYVHERRAWSVTIYNAAGDQLDDRQYSSKKNLAELEAQILRRNLKASIPIHVYTADFRSYRTK